MSRRLIVSLGLVFAIAFAANATSGEVPYDPADDLRLLQVRLHRTVLTDTLPAYVHPDGGVLVPLGALAALVGIDVTTDSSNGTAGGFVIEEKRRFSLDVARGEARLGGAIHRFDRRLTRLESDDIYIDSKIVSELFPIDLVVNLAMQRLDIEAREKLPLQMAHEREQRMQVSRLRQSLLDPGYPTRATEFSLFGGLPAVDQTVRFSFGSDGVSSRHTTYATSDILFMQAEAYVAGDDDDPFRNVRFTLGRKDPDARLLGFARAREVAFGHVALPGTSLVSHSQQPAAGFVIGNFPLRRSTQLAGHDLRGNLPPGWDVELYHNGALIGFERSGEEGQYRFEAVPLVFGLNVFRLVFYGPHGERREETQQLIHSDAITPAGAFYYRVGAIHDDERDTQRALVQLSYGLRKRLSANLELHALSESEQFSKAGVQASWRAIQAQASVVHATAGGSAAQLLINSRIRGMNVQLEHTELWNGYVSDVYPTRSDPLQRNDRVRIDTSIPRSFLPRIPVSLQLSRETYASGLTRTEISSRFSAIRGRFSMAHATNMLFYSTGLEQLTGFLQVRNDRPRFGVRGELRYSIAPYELTDFTLAAERRFFSYRITAGISHSLGDGGDVYTVGISKDAGSFGGRASVVSRSKGETSMNVDLSVGLSPQPDELKWRADARSKASFGAASARAFLDENRNGRRDAAEEGLKGVVFTVNRGRRTTSDSDGLAYIAALPAHEQVDIAIDLATIDDSRWTPTTTGARIIPRPGHVEVIDFPLVLTAEVEGTVWIARGENRQPVGGAKVRLVDGSGRTIKTETTAYDGFFVFTAVAAGTYRIIVDEEILSRLEVPAATDDRVVVESGKDVTGFALVLGKREETAAVVAALPVPTTIPSTKAAASAEIRVARVEPTRAAPSTRVISTAAAQNAAKPADRVSKSILVNVGIFNERAQAEIRQREIAAIVPSARIQESGPLFILTVGPFASDTEARVAREKLSAKRPSRG